MTDNVLRVVRDKCYKTVHLHSCDRDGELSWKAVGLHLYLTSRPDGWEFYKRDLVKRHSDGRHSVREGLKELKERGYLRIVQSRNDEGQIVGNTWIVSEKPLSDEDWQRRLEQEPGSGNPASGLPGSGNPASGNPTLTSSKVNKKKGNTPITIGNGAAPDNKKNNSPAHARENPDKDSGEAARKNGATSSPSSRELVHDNPEAGAFAGKNGSSPPDDDLPDDVIISRKGNPYRQLGAHPDSGNMIQAGRTKRGSYVADPEADVWVDLRENENWRDLTLYDAVHIMAQRAAHHRSLKYGTAEERDDYLEEQVFPGLEIIRG